MLAAGRTPTIAWWRRTLPAPAPQELPPPTAEQVASVTASLVASWSWAPVREVLKGVAEWAKSTGLDEESIVEALAQGMRRAGRVPA